MDELLRLDDSSFPGDLMERVIYNTLFAAQSPEGRQLRYYTAFEGPRSYWSKDTYCCPNNYRRIISEIPSFIYLPSPPDMSIELTEFTDPGGEAIYFKTPDPTAKEFVDDELCNQAPFEKIFERQV